MLVLKLPPGKPPFIGIRFEESVGSELNEDLINSKYAGFRLELERVHDRLDIRLISEALVTVRFYTFILYDKDKLKSFLYLTKDAKLYNFGHVKRIEDKDEIIKTKKTGKNWYLPIDSIIYREAEDGRATIKGTRKEWGKNWRTMEGKVWRGE